jgi:hypothetical protein
MFLSLGEQQVELAADVGPVLVEWDRIFAGWLQPGSPTDRPPDLVLRLTLTDHISPPAKGDLIFTDSRGIVDVYRRASHALLYFHAGALMQVDLTIPRADHPRRAEGVVTTAALRQGYLEDITYTSLAPLLRREGTYLLHAAAARRGDDAVLLVGASGSGKTTAALALMVAGWQLYANDIIAITQRDTLVYAHPTPGVVTVRANTLRLLPVLRDQASPGNEGGARLSAQLIGSHAPVAINAIYFPQVRHSHATAVRRLHRSLALARLLEESLDRWDEATLDSHTALLAALSEQCTTYRLFSGADIVDLDRHLRQQTSSGNGPR